MSTAQAIVFVLEILALWAYSAGHIPGWLTVVACLHSIIALTILAGAAVGLAFYCVWRAAFWFLDLLGLTS